MSAVNISLVGKYGSRSLQFYGLFVRCLSWQCRNVCRGKTSFGQHRPTLRPCAVVGLVCFRTGITPVHLPCLSSGVRWFSDHERDKNDDKGNQQLKGVAFLVPNPRMWLMDKWYTYRIQSLVDPLFSLREFHIGAKQALAFLTRLLVLNDFETLRTVASEEAVEKVRQKFKLWSPEQQQGMEIIVDNISFTTAYVTSLIKRPECYNVSVDFLCVALKRHNKDPLLISIGLRFSREYGTTTASDWLITDCFQFQVRSPASSKDSDQDS